MAKRTGTFQDNYHTLNVYLVADHALFAGQPQKKDLSPIIAKQRIKICETCFLCRSIAFVQHTTNVHTVAINLPVGYSLPFQNQPILTKFPVIVSGYVLSGPAT